jgi:hypothetical protein
MLDTAVALEATEAALHRAADESPDPATAARLDRLGDAITAEAKDIARRAGSLPPNPPIDRTANGSTRGPGETPAGR